MTNEPFDNGSVKGLWSYPNGPWGGAVRNNEIWESLYHKRSENLPKAHQWRDDAIADGWDAAPTYDREPLEHAARLTKDRWVCQILSRPILGADGSSNCPDITVWGPDGAQIKVPLPYSWEAILAAYRVCNKCGATDVETKRYDFADRCCADCGPKFQAALPPNWCD